MNIMKNKVVKEKDWAEYYEHKDLIGELSDEPVTFSLDDQLHTDIISKRRKRKLQNMTIKMDPLQIIAVRKLATTKSIPYQTLIRHWITEEIKKELAIA
jgi:hypothetical protein